MIAMVMIRITRITNIKTNLVKQPVLVDDNFENEFELLPKPDFN